MAMLIQSNVGGADATQPIVYFERAYLLSIALGAASVAVYWGELRQVAPPLPLAIASALLLGAVATLALFVSRRRSEVCKWLLVALTVAGIALSLPSLPASLAAGPRGWLGLAQMLLQAVAIAFLFTPPARHWLRRPRSAF